MVLIILACFVQTHQRVVAEQQCTVEDASCSSAAAANQDLSSCHLVLGTRKGNRNGGRRKFGVFANAPLPRGMPLPPSIESDITGDLVVHLIDVPDDDNVDAPSQLNKFLSLGYLVDATSSGYGGNYQGNGRVLSVLPGIGMMSDTFYGTETGGADNGTGDNVTVPKQSPNVWASIPTTDEANHPRRYSSLAGSFCLNYNLTFHAIRSLSRGEEVMVDRSGWFRHNSIKNAVSAKEYGNSPVQYEKGICLDSFIYPSHSKNGRGAFASRFIQEGEVLAYSPVLPLPRKELRYVRKRDRKQQDAVSRDQLLLNYCFGHENSSVLLYPYGSFVNFINHAPFHMPSGVQSSSESKGVSANVKLQWSEQLILDNDGVDPRTLTSTELWNRKSPEGLVLEYIALRPIEPTEEILLDYGTAWSNAWENHVKIWKENPLNNDAGVDAIVESMNNDYSPAYVMEDVVSNLRTAEEQVSFPYPKNVFTACFYKYERSESNNEEKSSTKALNEVTRWKMSRGLFDVTNLRPCKVIDREPAIDRRTGEQLNGGKKFYTAIIQNRPGLAENERIPTGEKHIVTGIPREAFRFVDRPYSSDEHLEDAFRHHIGLDVFPETWLDS